MKALQWGRKRENPMLAILAAVLVILCSICPAHSAVLSVDLGSEWLKVAVVNLKPGQSPISIAINEMSKRKSPALVAFSNGDRLLGEEALGISARYPERVYAQVRDMGGKPIEAVRGLLDSQYLPYEVVADDRGRASIRIHDASEVYGTEELLAMLLTYARDLAESHTKGVVKDAVISVPPYFGQAERQGVLDAAQIAGLTVLSLINEHSGAALQYGVDKDFSDQSKDVVFYDMGANSVYAAMVHFSAYPGKDRGKNVTYQQFQVKGVRWDASLGGQSMEKRLVEHFADEFKQQTGVDVRTCPKAMAKLKKQVKRTKHILSANTEAPLSVEALHDDRDFRSSISREKFEELCNDIWQHALTPLQQVLADTGLTPSQLHAMELIGGATRVPRLQAVLSDYVGKAALARHLDADEAVALGAALQAANLSDGIKLNRKIGMLDGALYGIILQFDGATMDPEDQRLLVPRLKKLPSKLFRSLKNQKQDFTVTLHYDEADSLPPGIPSSLIAAFKISGVAEAAAKYANHNLSAPVKSNLHFSLSRSGLIDLDKAETVVEVSEWVDVPVVDSNITSVPVSVSTNDSTDTTEANDIGNQASDTGSDSAGGADLKPPVKQKLRKRTIRIPLKIKDVTEGPAMALSDKAIAEAIHRLGKLNLKDAEKKQTAEAKNSLEAYIYATKDQLESMENLDKVSTEQQRDAFRVELGEAEDWLYTDGEDATAAHFKDRLAALKSTGESIFFRLEELKARPAAVQNARTYFEDVKQVLQGWKVNKPWLSENSRDEVRKELEIAQQWLDEKESQQQKVVGHEDPVFTSEQVFSKLAKVMDQVTKLDHIPKPKPKVEKPSEAGSPNSESNQQSNGDNKVGDAKPEEEVTEEVTENDGGSQVEDDVTFKDEL